MQRSNIERLSLTTKRDYDPPELSQMKTDHAKAVGSREYEQAEQLYTGRDNVLANTTKEKRVLEERRQARERGMLSNAKKLAFRQFEEEWDAQSVELEKDIKRREEEIDEMYDARWKRLENTIGEMESKPHWSKHLLEQQSVEQNLVAVHRYSEGLAMRKKVMAMEKEETEQAEAVFKEKIERLRGELRERHDAAKQQLDLKTKAMRFKFERDRRNKRQELERRMGQHSDNLGHAHKLEYIMAMKAPVDTTKTLHRANHGNSSSTFRGSMLAAKYSKVEKGSDVSL